MRWTGDGLYIYRAQKLRGAGELHIAFLSDQSGGCPRLRAISDDGEALQGQGDQKRIWIIRAAVEQAGGVCDSQVSWRDSLHRVYSLNGQLMVLCGRTKESGKRGPIPVQDPAAAALRRLLQRSPGLAGHVQQQPYKRKAPSSPAARQQRPQKARHASSAGGQAARSQPAGSAKDRTGCYVLLASRYCPGSGKGDVPLVCWRDEGGELQLGGITASGALLPREQSKVEVLGATARKWGWQLEDIPVRTSWHNLATRVYLLDGEWRAMGAGSSEAGDKMQAAAVQALSSFLAHHSWAADLSRPVGKRAKPEGAAAAASAGVRVDGRSSSPAASESRSDGGHSSSSASWAEAGERALCRAQKRRMAEVVAEEAATRATPTSSSHPPAAEQPAAARGSAAEGPAEVEAPAAAQQVSPDSGRAAAAWDWGGSSAGRGSSPPPTSAQLGGLPAVLPPTQEAARYHQWSLEAEACSLREGNQALADENARLRQAMAGARQAQSRLAELQARRQHLKARKAALQQQLQIHMVREQRVRQALEEE